MNNRMHEHIYYEIAMSIGNSLKLEQMLKEALCAYLRKLNCRAGVVLQTTPASRQGHLFQPVYRIPKRVQANPLVGQALACIPATPGHGAAARFRSMLPLTGSQSEGSYYIFDLPDFGLLVLVKSGEKLTYKEIRSLMPLNVKLARACISCIQNTRLQTEIAERNEAEEKYRSFFLNAVEGIFQSSLDGKLLDANPAMARMLGYDSREELLRQMTDLKRDLYRNPDDRNQFVSTLVSHGSIAGFEAQFMRKDGSLLWSSLSARLVLGAGDKGAHIEGICEDISAPMKVRFALQQAKDQAEALNRTKSRILTVVSHELRTPLTSILGFTKLMEKLIQYKMTPSVKDATLRSNLDRILENLRIVTSEGKRLTMLINNVLDLSKLEAGRMEWRMGRTDLREVIEHSFASMRPSFQNAGIDLVMDVPQGVPALRADRDRLVQICINLLSNAMKFTPPGGRVVCRAIKEDKELLVSVQDNGVGIPKRYQDSIFEVFNQVGDTLTGKPEGTGLGLSICKEIVEHHGGRIWVNSQEGKGSEFVFTLPLPS